MRRDRSTRISANVSGMFGTQRITLNDNLLKRASPAAVQAVMGHEMGHYVLNHVYEMLAYFAVIIAIGFAVTGWAFTRLAARYRERVGVSRGSPIRRACRCSRWFLAPICSS